MAAFLAWFATASAVFAAPIETEGLAQTIEEPESAKKFPEVLEAYEKLSQGDVASALERLKAASEKYPELSSAHVMLARFYFQANQGPAAVSALETAVKESPEDPDPYLNLGEYALVSRRLTDASLLFAKAGELMETFDGDAERKEGMQVRMHSGLAALGEAHKDWKVALDNLEAALEIKPDNPGLRQRLGQSLFWSADAGDGEFKSAHDALIAAVADQDEVPDAGVIMGRLYEQADNREMAKQWMDYAARATKGKPKELPTLLSIAQWYWQINDPAAAEPLARAALDLAGAALDRDARLLQANLLCGVTAHALGKTDEAEDFFWSAQNQSPGNFEVRNQLALVLADSTDPSKQRQAAELAQSNARDNPQNSQAAATFGWTLYRAGRANDGVRQLNATLKANPRISPQTTYFLARVAADQNQNDRASIFFKRALDANLPFVHRADAQTRHDQLASLVSPVSADSEAPPPVTTPNP